MVSIVCRLLYRFRRAPVGGWWRYFFTVLLLCNLALACIGTRAEESPVAEPVFVPEAPPPVPPVMVSPDTDVPPRGPTKRDLVLTLYSIGQPTDEEQLYLEYINRSRANPPAEGARLAVTTDSDVLAAYSYYSLNLALMQSQFNAMSSVAPLAMNARLLASARLHSGDMFTNQFQSHTSSDGTSFDRRITAQGYNWCTIGENVFSYAKSVWYGHAGFNVDWGAGTGGMQDPPGHRQNIHNADFREIGVGIVDGVNGSVGPQVVTQDFGAQCSAQPLICGVAYYDLNTNGLYDIGEGLGGITVLVDGATYYAVTADSGGYAVPVTTNGTYRITFTGLGLASTQQVTISGSRNVKVDFVPSYTSPTVSGPNPASVNQTNLYTISSVGGATNYQWLQALLNPYTTVEGGENGLTNVTTNTTSGYAVLTTTVKASGSYSFHLAHPAVANQYVTLNPGLRPATNTQLTFAKRLGYATSNQVAKAQVSADGGSTWLDVWSQAGSGSKGDTAFTTVTASLAAFAGRQIQVRFAYLFSSGSYYNSTSSGVGFYFDNIAFSNTERLLNQATNNALAGSATFGFCPTAATNYLLAARAQLSGRTMSWGPLQQVSATTPPPVLQLQGLTLVSGSQVQVDFTVSNYRAGMTFELWKATSPAGSWIVDSTASFQTVAAGSRYRAATARSATNAFYRLKGIY